MTPSPEPDDPRPLTGEPLAIDLLNTRWIDATGPHDLLESTAGLAVWLKGRPPRRLPDDPPVVADAETLEHLLRTRDALSALAGTPLSPTPGAIAELNAVLARGRVRRLLTPEGPEDVIEVDSPSWLPAWTAANDWLRLLVDRPERVRPCANPDCVLHFHDTSKNGTRRWCSMAGCGNRAKARRHHARRRPANE
ncbi:CGNR zinc finger domain-containing protein [Streptomyces sp. ST2-7A]|uniref:CGNR zinc finger domain-containing protein n=1 Tax=Streptomyces sp. ST2-7A TaxID=2907214 RepID=UPI001F48A9EE|nr:CGNR zinc finger domain-containing protein [Streptomyces sp. ST2-7A]MCE7079882.1 CGNR zinc finger domain-containing protein [Streptomyces sp. ST2-7A]